VDVSKSRECAGVQQTGHGSRGIVRKFCQGVGNIGVNDAHGHLTGDHLLADIGRRLDAVVRTTDIKCRYGGDEFLIIVPDTPAMGAHHVGETLRQALSSIVVTTSSGVSLSITVSVGLATTRADRDAVSVIARADRALYRAKQAGRNCVRDDESEPVSPLRLVSSLS
jgi:diguanylate cyclase (GGDEF)-like protein